jgi:HEAT repeat protein
VILDQFEEFFQYQRNTEYFDEFIKQLAQTITPRDVPIAMVISMREDFALELNAFKPYLPTILFENYYRLERLTEAEAKTAIVAPLEQVGFQCENVLLEKLLEDLAIREQDGYFSKFVPDIRDTIAPPYIQIICSQLWEFEQHDNTLRLQTYLDHNERDGLLKNYLNRVIDNFSENEKRLVSLAFDHLVSRRGTKIAHTVKSLAKVIHQKKNIEALGKVLNHLHDARILRSLQWQDVLSYELYHDLFSDSIDDWNKAYRKKQRTKNIFIFTLLGSIGVSSILGGTFLAYDWKVNKDSYYLQLSAKTGVSDTIEIYRGKLDSRDIFGLQEYFAETGYQQAQVEPDKLFNQKQVGDFEALNVELIGHLPLVERIEAYLETGKIDKALVLARKTLAQDEQQRSLKVINNLAKFRSIRGLELFEAFLKTANDSYLKGTIIWTLSTINTPQSIDLLIIALEDKDQKLRENAVKSLYYLDEITVLRSLIVARKEHSNAQYALKKVLNYLKNPKAVELLIPLLKDKNNDILSKVVQALGRLGEPKAVDSLIPLLKNDNAWVRIHVVNALSKLGDSKAIKPLIRLLQDKNNDILSRAVQALGRLGDSKAVDPLIPLLKKDNVDVEVRIHVINALSKLGNSKAIKPLIRLLQDKNADVRNSVVKSLRHFEDITVLRFLIAAKNDLANVPFVLIRKVLSDLDDPKAVELLIPLLKEKDSGVLVNAAWLLGRLGDSQAVEPLIPLLKDENAIVRYTTAKALARLGSAKAIRPLILAKHQSLNISFLEKRENESFLETLVQRFDVSSLIPLLKDENPEIRNYAAKRLGHLGDYKAVEPLILLLKDKDAVVRYSTAKALARLGSTKAIRPLILATHQSLKVSSHNPFSSRVDVSSLETLVQQFDASPLIPLLKDENAEVRNYAAKTLGFLGDSRAVEPLLPLLKDENVKVRNSAAKALSSLSESKTIESLIALLKDENVEKRKSAVKALGSLGDPKAVNLLIPLLEDKESKVRASAAQALGRLGELKAVEPLIPLLKDYDFDVQHSTAEALVQLGDAKAIRPLILATFKNKQRSFQEMKKQLINKFDSSSLIPLLEDDNAQVRNYVAKALGRLGDSKAVEPLISLLKDENVQVRDSAAKALGRLGDPKAVEPLIPLLRDNNVQYNAAEALIYLGDARGIRTLINAEITKIRGKDTAVQIVDKELLEMLNNVTKALSPLDNSKAIELLILLLKDVDAEVRLNTVKILGGLNYLRTVEHLVPRLKDENIKVRLKTIAILGGLGDFKVVEHLVPLLKDENRDVRIKTIKALGGLGELNVVKQYLKPLLKERDESIRRNVAEILGTLGIAEAFTPLVVSLKSPSTTVRQQGAKAIARLGSTKAINSLIELLKDDYDYENVAVSVATALCHLDNAEVVKPLIALPEEDWQNYHEAYRSIAKNISKNPKSVQPPQKEERIESLIGKLKDKSKNIRSDAATELGKLGNPKAVEPLIEMLKDKDKEVRLATLVALRKIGDTQASDAVIAVLKNDNEEKSVKIVAATTLLTFPQQQGLAFLTKLANSDWVDDRKQVAKVLGEVSTEPSLQLLITLLDDDNLNVKLQAIESLEKIKALEVLSKILATTTNAKVQKATVNALAQLASADSVPALRAAVTNFQITIPARLDALAALEKMVDKDTFIAMIMAAVQKDEMVLGLRVYNLLGKLKARQALPLLQNRLTQLEEQISRWRNLRDQERQYFTEEETEAWQQKLETAQPAFHWFFELAHAIAQIDPDDLGVKLLSHDIADVRYGAWLGLGKVGTVALVQRLDKERMASHDKPLFRHAAYRAIDHILNRLEVTGSEKELNALKEFLPQVKDKEGVFTRVAWTIQQLEYSMDILNAYFPQLMDKEDVHTQIERTLRQRVCSNFEEREKERRKRDKERRKYQGIK